MHDVRHLSDLVRYNLMERAATTKITKQPLKCLIHPTHELKLFCITCNQVYALKS